MADDLCEAGHCSRPPPARSPADHFKSGVFVIPITTLYKEPHSEHSGEELSKTQVGSTVDQTSARPQ